MINKLEAQRKAGHEQPVVPDPSVPTQSVQQQASDIKDLTARVDNLEQRIAVAPPLPAQSKSAGTSQPAPGPTSLQDVLPQIKDLAEKVGGLDHLAEIIDTLKQPQG
jgi:hypothetical protein